jgi:hypothetical protein
MGQSTSFMSEAAAGCTPTPPMGEASSGMEMETMLRDPTSSYLPGDESGAGEEVSGAAAAAAAAPPSSATVSVFCLDVSKRSLLQLRQVLETPVPDRAAAFHRVAKKSHGVLLHAPASTTLQTLKSFLLSEAAKGRFGGRGSADAPSSLHVFALQDPTVVVDDSGDGPVVVTREMSTDLLIPLGRSVELAVLASDATILGFPSENAEGASPAAVSASASAVDGVFAPAAGKGASKEARQAGSEAGAVAAASVAPRTVLLLCTRDSSFGFDSGNMLCVGCCVAMCACIAAAICCCMTSKKSKQSSGNDQKPNSGYYGPPPQPNGNYGNPYAPNGYGGNMSNAPMNGYGAPPNAYNGNDNYQNQYQNQQQPQMNYGNNNGYSGTGGQQPNPAPL